jgi:hypothetical protein|nr:hypothetical protein [Neorhizobium tomejilense]
MRQDPEKLIASLQRHIVEFTAWFNEAAAKDGLGISLDPARVIEDIRTMNGSRLRQLSRAMREHQVHKEQVQTSVSAISETLARPGESGIILGALQSGKTGTAFMTLFAAPIHHLKSKVSFVPLFVTTNQKSHLLQTQKAMRAFFNLYGDITIRSNGESRSLIDFYAQSGSDLVESADVDETSLNEYHEQMADDFDLDYDIDRMVEGMTVKRVPGEISGKVRSFAKKARDKGYAVMLIVDEPQYGAAGATAKDGTEVPCLLTRIFDEIDEDFFSPVSPNFVVGLSATPFDTAILDRLWLIRQKLNENYCGPNFFGGQLIDPTVQTKLPIVRSFKEMGMTDRSLEWFSEIPYLLGATKFPERNTFRATKIGPDGKKTEMTQFERQQRAAELIRQLLDQQLMTRQERTGTVQGALLRIANKTELTEKVLEAMGLAGTGSPYNVIKFYNIGGDIKEIIKEKTRNDARPYIVVTVGKGRMGDAFPSSTTIGIDLSQTSGDANSFLQGVFGRMCGYGKKNPLVIVSNAAKELFAELVETNGRTENFDLNRNNTQMNVVEKGRNRTENYFMITNEMIDVDREDSPLRGFRDDLVAYLEQQELAKPTLRKDVPRRRSMYMNLPEIMEKHGLVDYIAKHSTRLDPELQNGARIVGFGETTTHQRRSGKKIKIGFLRNQQNECAVLVSKVGYDTKDSSYNAGLLHRGHGGGLSATGARSAAKHVNRGRRDDGIKASVMPTITVKKVDEFGNTVDLNEKGRFVFDGIVFTLHNEVKRYRAPINDVVLAPNHAFRRMMTEHQGAIQLGFFAFRFMKRGNRSLDEALGQWNVQNALSNLYDAKTHRYEVIDKTILFRDIITGQPSNPKGPTAIDLTDPVKPILHAVVNTYDPSLGMSHHAANDDDLDVDVTDIEFSIPAPRAPSPRM